MFHHRTGSLLGVGVCLAAMSVDGSPTARTHVTQMQEQLLLALQMNSPMSDDYAVNTAANNYESTSCVVLLFISEGIQSEIRMTLH